MVTALAVVSEGEHLRDSKGDYKEIRAGPREHVVCAENLNIPLSEAKSTH